MTTFQDVDAPFDLAKTEIGTPCDRGEAEGHPLLDHQADVFSLRLAIEADRHHIDREVFLQRRVRLQQAHELVRILLRGARFKHQTHAVVLVRFVVDLFQRAEDELLEVGLARRHLAALFSRLGVGQFLNFFHDAHGRGRRRQFVHHHLPLPPREVLQFPAAARAQGAAAAGISVQDCLLRADDLSATGEIRSLDNVHQRFNADVRPINHRDCGVGHLTQVVRLQLAGHAYAHA